MTTHVDRPQDTSEPTAVSRPDRRGVLVAAAAVVLALLAAAVGLALAGLDDEPPAAPAAALTLRLPGTDVSSSCVVFDEAVLAEMPLAFAGTVTAVDGTAVTLTVDRWYRSGTPGPESVQLRTPDATSSAVLDGIALVQAERYLVTASGDGMVNGCGFTGRWSPELEASFARAFD